MIQENATGAPEGPRAATVPELPAVVGLSNAVFSPGGGGNMGGAFPVLFHADNVHNLRICLDDGMPVSLVAMIIRDMELGGARVRAALIGSVCTLEAYRGQALAGKLMDDAVAAARAQGAVIILVSGWRGLYRRMGCIDAGLYKIVTVNGRSRFPKMDLEVRPWTQAEVPGMAILQRRERVRFLRGEEETRTILASGSLFARPGQTWVVHHQGRLSAWFSAHDPVRTEDGRDLTVREIAGSRLAALVGICSVLRTRKMPSAEVDALESDTEMGALASAFGLAVSAHGFHGTVKIVDPAGFMRSLEPWIEERLGGVRAELRVEAGERTTFTLDSARGSADTPGTGQPRGAAQPQSYSLENVEDLAALVFGSVERTAPPAPAGPLADAMARLFPVPLPGYGLSYT